jgi:hypothetical protein
MVDGPSRNISFFWFPATSNGLQQNIFFASFKIWLSIGRLFNQTPSEGWRPLVVSVVNLPCQGDGDQSLPPPSDNRIERATYLAHISGLINHSLVSEREEASKGFTR